MRESKAYLLFFKNNFSYFLTASLLFTTLGSLVQLQKPVQYKSSMLLEISPSSTETVSEKTSLVQEAVTLVRSQNIQQEVGINSKITVFNNSPLTLTVESMSTNKDLTLTELSKISDFLTVKLSFHQLGQIVTTAEYPNLLIGGLAGFLIGNLLVVSVLLIRTYVRFF